MFGDNGLKANAGGGSDVGLGQSVLKFLGNPSHPILIVLRVTMTRNVSDGAVLDDPV